MFASQLGCMGMNAWGTKGSDGVIEAQEVQDCVP